MRFSAKAFTPCQGIIDAPGPEHNLLLLSGRFSLALSLWGLLVYALACMRMHYVVLARHDHRPNDCHCSALPFKLDMSRNILENRQRRVKISEIVRALQCSITL